MKGVEKINSNNKERLAEDYMEKRNREMRAWAKKTGGTNEIWYKTLNRLGALEGRKLTKREIEKLVTPALTHPHLILRDMASKLIAGKYVEKKSRKTKKIEPAPVKKRKNEQVQDPEIAKALHEIGIMLGDETVLDEEFRKLEEKAALDKELGKLEEEKRKKDESNERKRAA